MDEALAGEIRRIDAVLDPLIHYGIDPAAPGLRRRLPALAAEMRTKHRAAEAMRAQADLLLPQLLDFYLNGRDQDRKQLRELLLEGARSAPAGNGDAAYFASLRAGIAKRRAKR